MTLLIFDMMSAEENLGLREGSRGAHLLRRGLHLALSGVLLYYLLPYRIFGVGRVWYLLLVLISVPTVVEGLRLRYGKMVFGLREYEKERVASYYWFIIGATLVMALFPQVIAAPVIVAVSIGDPIIGETRHLRRRWWMSIGSLTCIIVYFVFQYSFFLALFAGVVTFFAESVQFQVHWSLRDTVFMSRSKGTVSPWAKRFDLIFNLDDDLIMQLIPTFLLLIIFNLFPHVFPSPIIIPDIPVYP